MLEPLLPVVAHSRAGSLDNSERRTYQERRVCRTFA